MHSLLSFFFIWALTSPASSGVPSQPNGVVYYRHGPEWGSGICYEFGHGNGVFPHPYQCEQYLVCSRAHTEELDCPSKSITDACSISASNSNDASWTEQEEGEHESRLRICEENGYWEDVYPHPSSCNLYISCTNGLTEELQCPSSNIQEVCTYSGYEVNCGGDETPVSTYCKDNGLESGYYADPNNCEGYIVCDNGFSFHMDCPDGTAYNSAHEVCVQNQYSDCYGDGSWPSWNDGDWDSGDDDEDNRDKDNTEDREWSTNEKDSTYCKDNGQLFGFYPNSDNCEGYIVCSNGFSFLMDCPDGTAYNSAHEVCVQNQYSDCYGDGSWPSWNDGDWNNGDDDIENTNKDNNKDSNNKGNQNKNNNNNRSPNVNSVDPNKYINEYYNWYYWGGLFGSGDDHPSLENAFRYAVYRVNHDRKILPDTKLIYDIQNLPVTNAFASSKKVCQQVSKNTIAIFGPQTENIAGFVNSLCASLQIPHIEVRGEESTRFFGPVHALNINLYPGLDQLARAYVDVISYYGWEEFIVIYGPQYGLSKVQRVLRGDFQPRAEMMVRYVDDYNMRSVLKEAKEKKIRRILVDLPVEETYIFLKMALQEGMIDPYHHYIITNLDVESINMEDFRHNYVNLTGFRIVDPTDQSVRKILHDMEIYEMQTDLRLLNTTGYLSLPHEVALMYDSVLLLANALERFNEKTIWKPLLNASCDSSMPWSAGLSLYTFLNEVHIKGLTGDISLVTGRRLDFKVDILQLSNKGLVKGGEWRVGAGLNVTYDDLQHRGSPFGNKTLVVTTLKETPFVMENDKPTAEEMYQGFCIDLAKELARLVGFTYKIELVPDNNYGNKNENGEWDGMVRELIDRRADLAIAPLTITYQREQVIDFTKPFINLGISILFKVPRREKPGLFSFLNPLAIEIWLYVIGAYLTVSFTIFILARFSPYEWYNPHPCNPNIDHVENNFNLSNSFWFTVGTLMQQGSDINPRAVSTRIVGGIWWFFTLIIISSYTANLAAFLTVERMVSPIESADDLLKQTEIEYGTRLSSSTLQFFKDSNLEPYNHIYNYMKDRPHVMSETYEDGIARVKKGNYAFFMENLMIDYQVQNDCDLMQVGGQIDSKGYGVGLPMNSPYRDKLSMAILELQEDGVIQALYRKWWTEKSKCIREENKESKANALGVENVGGIFVVLLVGLALAIVIAICEFVWKSKKNAKEDRQSLCSEMAEELRFAVRCGGSSKRPKYKPSNVRVEEVQEGVPVYRQPGITVERRGPESPNGILQQQRPSRHSPSPVPSSTRSGRSVRYETEFKPCGRTTRREFNGDYQHVDYSDGEV